MKSFDPRNSGDVDSFEFTELQQSVMDIYKLCGKLAVTASESNVRFTVEKPEGFKNFLYQMKKLQDAGKYPSEEETRNLEKEVRYEEREERIGNRTLFLNQILANVIQDPRFRELQKQMIDEIFTLTKKRSDARYFAQSQTKQEFGW